jgi:hypothetical protein
VGDPLAVTIRWRGDPDELLDRFERARESWIAAQDGEYARPLFYAACRSDEGIAIVSVWENARAHRAFGQGLHAHIDGAGLGPPDRIERMPVERLGWD